MSEINLDNFVGWLKDKSILTFRGVRPVLHPEPEALEEPLRELEMPPNVAFISAIELTSGATDQAEVLWLYHQILQYYGRSLPQRTDRYRAIHLVQEQLVCNKANVILVNCAHRLKVKSLNDLFGNFSELKIDQLNMRLPRSREVELIPILPDTKKLFRKTASNYLLDYARVGIPIEDCKPRFLLNH